MKEKYDYLINRLCVFSHRFRDVKIDKEKRRGRMEIRKRIGKSRIK